MKILSPSSKNISRILFIDIETCANSSCYEELHDVERQFWERKSSLLKIPKDGDYGTSPSYFYKKRAGIYAEFSRVICISIGYIDIISVGKAEVNTKSFFNLNEAQLLSNFVEFINRATSQSDISFLAGHNIKEFDIPFLCRRMIKSDIKLPKLFNLSGKRPWQCPHLLDTLEMWKFGDYKSYVSLDQLCYMLNIPSSKLHLSGDKIHDVFWCENDYFKICEYCETDVFVNVLVFLKLKQWYLGNNFKHCSKTDSQSIVATSA